MAKAPWAQGFLGADGNCPECRQFLRGPLGWAPTCLCPAGRGSLSLPVLGSLNGVSQVPSIHSTGSLQLVSPELGPGPCSGARRQILCSWQLPPGEQGGAPQDTARADEPLRAGSQKCFFNSAISAKALKDRNTPRQRQHHTLPCLAIRQTFVFSVAWVGLGGAICHGKSHPVSRAQGIE